MLISLTFLIKIRNAGPNKSIKVFKQIRAFLWIYYDTTYPGYTYDGVRLVSPSLSMSAIQYTSPLNDTSEVARCVLCSLLIACYIPPSNLKYPDKKIIFRRAKSSICTSALTSEVVVNCNIDSHSLYYKS